eukprot:CAMPEP_0171106876 /NCGR_PEP_ID=MMETSP0766_2-20121228/65741_1 /TAXON_ID=439317 /ORGANISM="Gambierdiscus australes, Strain CAWD 149" /LENGTH=97 /DNA_ID=CAMNT_0011568083 /DNA_START=317 /DNA_END=607 /DNA_ORIENTATION=+
MGKKASPRAPRGCCAKCATVFGLRRNASSPHQFQSVCLSISGVVESAPPVGPTGVEGTLLSAVKQPSDAAEEVTSTPSNGNNTMASERACSASPGVP